MLAQEACLCQVESIHMQEAMEYKSECSHATLSPTQSPLVPSVSRQQGIQAENSLLMVP